MVTISVLLDKTICIANILIAILHPEKNLELKIAIDLASGNSNCELFF